MDKKNIWIINHYAIPPSLGGLNRHYYFTKELIARGCGVKIFTASTIHNSDINFISEKSGDRFFEKEVDGVAYTFVKTKSYKGNGLARIKNMLGFMFNIQKIKKAYGEEKPDVIYTSTPDLFTALSAEILAKRMRIPCIVEVRDLWPMSIVEYKNFSQKNPIIQMLYLLEKWIYKKANALIFTIEGGKQYISDKKWSKAIKLDKVFNINNGVDFASETMQGIDNYETDDVDLTDDAFKVVYAGSIRTANRLDIVISAAKLLENYKDIKFLIYGDGDKRAELENSCKNYELNNVVFKGKVSKSEIKNIIKICNVGLLTYKNAETWKYGGSQNKVFEYMNAGIPTLTNINMNYSILKRYNCGIDVGDTAESVANGLLKIYHMENSEYIQMCRNAKAAVKEFDFAKLTDKLEKVIEFAMENK